jgi:hypothetical protein
VKRLATSIVALLLASVVIAPYSLAAIKPGSACKKAGLISVESGRKFTCVKQGKKFVWDKGVVVKPVPAKVPTPTPTPTPTPSPTATTPVVPTSFADLWEKRSGISYASWSSAVNAMSKNPSSLPPIEIFRGPNTPTYSTDAALKTALEDVSKLYSGTPMPKKIQFFIYSRADLEWGIAKAKAEMGAEYQNAIDAHGGPLIKCNVPDDCNDGDAFVGSNSVAYLAQGISIKPNELVLASYKSLWGETCEFYHSLQEYFYELNGSKQKNNGILNPPNKPPHWLNVGGENLTSAFIRYKGDYQGYRSLWLGNTGWINSLGYDFNSKWIDDYLSITNLNNMWSNNRFGPPSTNAALMGHYITDILVAIKGPPVLLEFHKQMSAGASFEKVFQDVYGISWAEASPIISRVILDAYKNNN